MKYKIVLLILVFVLLSGCATPTPFRVWIDSINTPEAKTKKCYALVPRGDSVQASDMQFIEFSKYVDQALAAKGFVKAGNPLDADIGILLFYEVGDYRERPYTYSEPIRGQTGVSSSTTTGTISSYGGISSYSNHTRYNPSYGVIGHETHSGTRFSCVKAIVLEAIDLTEMNYLFNNYKTVSQDEIKQFQSRKMVTLWRTNMGCVDSSSDMRRMFPVIIAASIPYIGENTGQTVEVKLHETDQRVTYLKRAVRGEYPDKPVKTSQAEP